MLPSYRTMKYKSPIWGVFSCLEKVKLVLCQDLVQVKNGEYPKVCVNLQTDVR